MITEEEEREFNADVRRRQAERARREALAAGGDVDAIWAELTRPRPVPVDPAEFFPLLLKAVEAGSRLHPERFSAEILARVVALTSYLVLRSHYLLAARVEQYDRSAQGRGRVELPPAFHDRVIPQTLALHGSLAEILHTQASVARAWELAKGKKIENDRAGGKPPAKAVGKATPKPGPKGKAKAPREPGSVPAHVNGTHNGNGKHDGDGKPVNRIAGLMNGPGPAADGVHHDD